MIGCDNYASNAKPIDNFVDESIQFVYSLAGMNECLELTFLRFTLSIDDIVIDVDYLCVTNRLVSFCPGPAQQYFWPKSLYHLPYLK